MKYQNDMTHVETTNPIDLASWGAFALCPELGQRISALVRQEFEDHPPRLELPYDYSIGSRPTDGFSGPPVSDPAMLYVSLPLGPNEDEHCVYACSLEGVIDHVIEMHGNDDESCELYAEIATRLRELAAKLDKASAGKSE